ncbi:DNA/RNA nuclease SfsA [Pseudoalteromonas tunicata]|uniref:DNA/RNA nuclease SfsA n=1 Tax=Pseudoalteromonas tunicata TaxID=314281 RepID=UPI00273F23AC|nr:DNA/RNA nuclease SfsA [Pseudoalteromonas tunicata]MDP4985287.1 DNA/RNA nuclease SfsA [Pseudoalteromonas tunicata]
MKFEPALQSATLIKRYKRFLVDIVKEDHTQCTIHCANTGAMTGCADSGYRAFYSTSSNTKRKYPHSLELTQNMQGQLICVNTALANKIVLEALHLNQIPELDGYNTITAEVKYGSENSRIDILLSQNQTDKCYVEIKSVTLLGDNHQGFFPDAVSTRGQKHLRELIEMKQQGHRAVLLFLVQHQGIQSVKPAAHIDPNYALGINAALKAGVEVLCYNTHISAKEITLNKRLTFSY